MFTTSHFIGLELNPKVIADIFVRLQRYLYEEKIQDIASIQNPLSPHITLYYLEADISKEDKKSIWTNIGKLDVESDIYLKGFDYFYKDNERFILYLTSATSINLKEYRNILHEKYHRTSVTNNNLGFTSHITLLRILNIEIFEKHRMNIEKIISEELKKIQDVDINSRSISLYAVNSNYNPELQIKI